MSFSWRYKRTSQYLYIPAGIRTNLINNKNLQIKLTAEYDFLIKGQQTSDLTAFPEYNYKSKSSQNSGFGARMSLDLGFKINKKTPIIISPFINYWDIDDSEPDQKNQFYEPKNNTIESGVKIYLLI